MTYEQNKLQQAARKLCAKFYEDAQRIFDSPHMDDALYMTETMQALLNAQGYAQDATS